MAHQRQRNAPGCKSTGKDGVGEHDRRPSQPPVHRVERQHFRSKDLERVLTVAKRAGLTVTSVELIPGGTITIRFGEQTDPTEAELDEELRLWRLERDRQDREQQPKKRR